MSSAAWASKATSGLGFFKEMEAIEDPVEREKYFPDQGRLSFYANGRAAVSSAWVLEIDEVIDPADTRHWIMAGLGWVPAEPRAAPQAPVYRRAEGGILRGEHSNLSS